MPIFLGCETAELAAVLTRVFGKRQRVTMGGGGAPALCSDPACRPISGDRIFWFSSKVREQGSGNNKPASFAPIAHQNYGCL